MDIAYIDHRDLPSVTNVRPYRGEEIAPYGRHQVFIAMDHQQVVLGLLGKYNKAGRDVDYTPFLELAAEEKNWSQEGWLCILKDPTDGEEIGQLVERREEIADNISFYFKRAVLVARNELTQLKAAS